VRRCDTQSLVVVVVVVESWPHGAWHGGEEGREGRQTGPAVPPRDEAGRRAGEGELEPGLPASYSRRPSQAGKDACTLP
jgi:hypothetical protein